MIAVLKDKVGEFNAKSGHDVRLVVILITNDPEETIPGAPIDEAKAGSPFLTEVFGPITALFRTRDARGSFAQVMRDILLEEEGLGTIAVQLASADAP